jgi:hypothetical protein
VKYGKHNLIENFNLVLLRGQKIAIHQKNSMNILFSILLGIYAFDEDREFQQIEKKRGLSKHKTKKMDLKPKLARNKIMPEDYSINKSLLGQNSTSIHNKVLQNEIDQLMAE